MDIFKMESLKKEFPDLQEILDQQYREMDLERVELSVKVQRVDQDFLKQVLVEQEDNSSPRRKESYYLWAFTKQKTWYFFPPRFRRWNTVRGVPMQTGLEITWEDKREEARRGRAIFYALQEMNHLEQVVRLILIYTVEEGSNFPFPVKKMEITILKVPKNVRLGSYIEELLQQARNELLGEIGDTD